MKRKVLPILFAWVILFGMVLLTSCGTEETVPTPTQSSPTPSPANDVQEGDQLLRSSDLTGAFEAYQRALEIDQNYSPAYIGLSQVYYWQYLYEEALTQAEKAVEFAPDEAEPYIVLSHAQRRLNNISGAIESAEEAVSMAPEDGEAYAVLSLAYLIENQYEQAKEAVEKAYDLAPDSPDVNFALGVFHQNTADFIRAQAAFEYAAEVEPQFFAWHQKLGYFFHLRNQFDEAANSFNKAVELTGDLPISLTGLALVKVSQRDFESAEAYIQEAEDKGLVETEIHIIRGYSFLVQQEYDDALEQYNKVLDLSPDHPYALAAIADIYLNQYECEQAETQFQELNRDYPKNSYYKIGHGYAEICAGDPAKALTHFRDAAELNPYDYEAHIGLGYAYLYQDRWEDARDAYLDALQLSPSPANIHSKLGSWSYYQGFLDDAEMEFQIALEQNPYLINVYLSLEDVYLFNSQYDEALEIAEKALALDDDYLDAKIYSGIAYYLHGDLEQAVNILKEALEDDPEDPISHHYLGLAYRDQGNYLQAKKEIETFQTLGEYYLTDNENDLLDMLIDALDLGYTISEEKAIDDIEEILEYILGWKPEVNVQDLEDGGRTLVITMPINSADLESADALVNISIASTISAILGPRIDPPIPNGLLVKVEVWGETQFTGAFSLTDLKQFADTLISAEEFVQRIDLSILSSTYQPTPFWQIEQKVVDLREIDRLQPVSYETVTSDDYQERLTESIDEEDRVFVENDDAVLTMLGLIPPTMNLEDAWVDLYAEQVVGYYVPDEDTLYIIEQEEPSFDDEVTYAHEYVHALQDQIFDLEELTSLDQNDDQALALDALIEGDATFASGMYMNENISVLDAFEAATEQIDLEYETFESMPYFIQEMATFPYFAGLEFVSSLYQRGGWEEVNAAYQDLPQSTEQILHPEYYWSKKGPAEVMLFELESTASAPWSEIDRNVMGEFGLRLSLTEHIGPVAGIKGAEGWGSDEYLLLHNPEDDSYAWIIRTYWDDQDEADEFWALFRHSIEHQSEYDEIVEVLVGEQQSHWWESDTYAVMITQQDLFVTIVIGPNREVVSQLASDFINE